MQLTVRIGDETHDINLSDELDIHNADDERHTVASKVAWWGSIAAAAEAEAEKLAASAAKHFNWLIAEALKQDAKVSEWKAKAMAGADEAYGSMLASASDGQEQARRASSIHWTFIRKMDMLRAMIAGDNGTQRSSNDVGRTPDSRFEGFRRNRQHKEE